MDTTGLPEEEVFVDAAGHHVIALLGTAQQVEAYVKAGQVVGHLHRRPPPQEADVGQPLQQLGHGVLLPAAQKDEGAGRHGLGGVQNGGEVQIPPQGAGIAQNGAGEPPAAPAEARRGAG